jgi:hypothetical protein
MRQVQFKRDPIQDRHHKALIPLNSIQGVYGISVYLAGEISPEEVMKRAPSMYLAEFAAIAACSCGCKDSRCGVQMDPLRRQDQPAQIFNAIPADSVAFEISA